MYKTNRDSHSSPRRGGGKSFGGSKPWERGGAKPWERGPRDTGSVRAEMHAATCNNCGKSCEVPFKPNGKKPIYCSSCFFKEGGRESKREEGMRPEKTSFGSGDYGVQDQLKKINAKLDAILEMLES